MNDNHYGSLDACKRLLDVGKIQIDTDFCWFERETDDWIILPSDDVSIKAIKDNHAYPAVCMVEVWRELPVSIYHHTKKRTYNLEIGKTLQGGTYAGYIYEEDGFYEHYEEELQVIIADNPADAMIDLLIHIKGIDAHK